ncbi:hypothetical protein [Psychrobacter sp. I-STPA10]|uniref:hypothetical protein n=1 Tax=Psychrobacter sp. I-STPA10 TaxID=2585769 RepID=UPI001E377344|nr:hypothetical protein [Psychrobacter sp. I-STPA10]
MKKSIYLSSVLFVLAACTTDNQNDQSTAEISSTAEQTDLIDSTVVNDIVIHDSDTNKKEERFEDSEAILNRATNRWQTINGSSQIQSSYDSLLALEKEGDMEFARGKYGTAWNRYSSASVYYPSPKLMVKAGDAQMLHYITHFKNICICDKNELPEDIRRTTIRLDYLRYNIRREYGLALDFNRYPKDNYNDAQSLSKAEEQQLIKKIDCLYKQLDFEGDSIEVDILQPCMQ